MGLSFLKSPSQSIRSLGTVLLVGAIFYFSSTGAIQYLSDTAVLYLKEDLLRASGKVIASAMRPGEGLQAQPSVEDIFDAAVENTAPLSDATPVNSSFQSDLAKALYDVPRQILGSTASLVGGDSGAFAELRLLIDAFEESPVVVRRRRGGAPPRERSPAPTPNPETENLSETSTVEEPLVLEEPSAVDETVPPVYPLRDNPIALGVSTFPLADVNFPLEDQDQVDGIGYKTIASVLRRIATNQLWTQPTNINNERVIDILSEFITRGQEVTHNIYILDGPGGRRSKTAFYNNLKGGPASDDDFRSDLIADQTVRDAVLNLFTEVVTFAKRLEAIGVDVYITPELEDNQNEQSFAVLLELLRQAGWTNADGSLRKERTIRNSVDNRVTESVDDLRREYHIHNLVELNIFEIRPGDFINMDGRSFTYRNQEVSSRLNNTGLFSEDEVRFMIEFSETQRVVFYIWDAPLQYSSPNQPEGAHIEDFTVQYDQPDLIQFKLLRPLALMSMLLKLSEDELTEQII